MSNLPVEKRPRWFATEFATTIFASLPTFVTAVGGVAKGVRDQSRGFIELGAGVLVALFVGTAFRALQSRRKDAREAAKRSPRDLEGCLYVLHASILAMRGLPYEDHAIAKLRVTIHRLLDHEDKVLQILPFVGGGSGGDGTRLSGRSGVVGRAILRGQAAAMIRDGSFDDYVQLLVDEYATHAHEARALDADRFAFLAVPLKQKGTSRVVGVIYMDSPDRSFFSDPEQPGADISAKFVQQIAAACTGLATYAELRYPSEGSGR
jgi:hypothetical protein